MILLPELEPLQRLVQIPDGLTIPGPGPRGTRLHAPELPHVGEDIAICATSGE